MAIDRSLRCHLPARRQFPARFLSQAQNRPSVDRVQRGVKTNCWHPCALTHSSHLFLQSYERDLKVRAIRSDETPGVGTGQRRGPLLGEGAVYERRNAGFPDTTSFVCLTHLPSTVHYGVAASFSSRVRLCALELVHGGKAN